MEQPPKRQKINERSAITFWNWYIPHSRHPKKGSHELPNTFFRYDAAYKVYYNLVRRKWHLRWYMMFILNMNPYLMGVFELLRGQGAFQKCSWKPPVVEFWEQ